MTFCSHPRENGDPDSRGDPHALRAGDDARHFRGNDGEIPAFAGMTIVRDDDSQG